MGKAKKKPAGRKPAQTPDAPAGGAAAAAEAAKPAAGSTGASESPSTPPRQDQSPRPQPTVSTVLSLAPSDAGANDDPGTPEGMPSDDESSDLERRREERFATAHPGAAEGQERAETVQQVSTAEAMREAAYELAAAITAEQARREATELETSRCDEQGPQCNSLDAQLAAVRLERDRQHLSLQAEEVVTQAEEREAEMRKQENARRQEEALARVAARVQEQQRLDALRQAEQERKERDEQHRKQLEDERRREQRVRLEAQEALLELAQQGSLGREVLCGEAGPPTVSPSLPAISQGPCVPQQQVECLTRWVNSVLPQDKAVQAISDLLTSPLAFALLVERLLDHSIPGVVRAASATTADSVHNVKLVLALLQKTGANKLGIQYDALVAGGEAALCDVLWEMAEVWVMAPQFASLAMEADADAESAQAWMEGVRLWVQQMTKISVSDFAESFRDGRLLLAIIVAAWPGCMIDPATTTRENTAEEVVELALSIAHSRWQVPKLLSTAVVEDGADPACVLLYLTLLSRRLPLPERRPDAGGLGSVESDRIAGRDAAPPGVGAEGDSDSRAYAGGATLQAYTNEMRKFINRMGEDEGVPAVGWPGARPGEDAESQAKADVSIGLSLDTPSHVVIREVQKGSTVVPWESVSAAVEWRHPAANGGGGGKAAGPVCAGCYSPMLRPRLLRCLHIFCLPCLEGMTERLGSQGMVVRCPACAMSTAVGGKDAPNSLESMNSDEGVLKLISLLSAHGAGGLQSAATRPSLCDNCLETCAAVWCGACDAALCTECSAQVHSFRSMQSHNPRRLQAGERAPPRLPTCRRHPGEKLLFLSISRQELICRECVLVGGHDRDRYVPVEDAGRQTRMDLADMIKQLRHVETLVDRNSQEAGMRTPTVLDTHRARTQRLDARTEELTAAVHERKTAALGEVAAERDRKTQRLLLQGVDIGRVAVALEHGAVLGQLLVSRGNDLELLRASQGLEKLMRAACALPVDAAPVEGPALFAGEASGASRALGGGRRGSLNTQSPHLPAPSLSGVAASQPESEQVRTQRVQGPEKVRLPANDMAQDEVGTSSTSKRQLFSLAEPALVTPKPSAPSSPLDSLGAVGMWGGRREGPNGTVQHMGIGRSILGADGHTFPPQTLFGQNAQRLYAIGGFDGAKNLDSMEFLDSAVGEWRLAPSLPCARRGLAAAASEGRIFVLGGWDGKKYLDSMAVFDSFTGRWAAGPSMLCARCFAAATFVGPHLYVVGGYHGATNLKSAERFDPRSNVWETLPNMAAARRGLGVASHKARLLLAIGGWDGKMNLASVECLDVQRASATWVSLAPLRVPRCSLACASAGDVIFVCGGWDGNDYLASVEALAPDEPNANWQMLTRMKTPRSYGAVCVSSSSIEGGRSSELVVMGGWDGVGTRRLASVESLSVESLLQGRARDRSTFVGEWRESPTMLSARYGGALVAV